MGVYVWVCVCSCLCVRNVLSAPCESSTQCLYCCFFFFANRSSIYCLLMCCKSDPAPAKVEEHQSVQAMVISPLCQWCFSYCFPGASADLAIIKMDIRVRKHEPVMIKSIVGTNKVWWWSNGWCLMYDYHSSVQVSPKGFLFSLKLIFRKFFSLLSEVDMLASFGSWTFSQHGLWCYLTGLPYPPSGQVLYFHQRIRRASLSPSPPMRTAIVACIYGSGCQTLKIVWTTMVSLYVSYHFCV